MSYEHIPNTALKNKNKVIASGLDFDEYRHDLVNFNMTEEQENELLEVLWNIMKTMVEIGWGVNNVQYILPGIFDSASTHTKAASLTTDQERNVDDQ